MKFLASAVVLRFTKTAVCHPWTNGSFSCDGLVVQAGCLKARR